MEIETINTQKALVSVIVPIYKAEETLLRCLDSLKAQTFTDFEVLMVDDGSPDHCGQMIDDYAQKDFRFKAFHKENGGVSSARQYGIDHAQGEYTIHADPDDWVEPTMLKDLYKIAKEEDADMVICDYYINTFKGQHYICQKPSSLHHNVVLKEILVKLHGSCCNKLIKLSCYNNYNIVFPQDLSSCEDQYVTLALLKESIRVSYVSNAYYHYVAVSGSLSRHYDKNTYENDLLVREMFVNLLADTPYKDLAFERKTSYMFGRAFMFGYKWFNSKRFVEEFGEYEDLIFTVPRSRTYNFFYWLSFRGFYRLSRNMFGCFFTIKKRIIRLFI